MSQKRMSVSLTILEIQRQNWTGGITPPAAGIRVKCSLMPETSCLHYLLLDKRDVSATGSLQQDSRRSKVQLSLVNKSLNIMAQTVSKFRNLTVHDFKGCNVLPWRSLPVAKTPTC